MRELLTIGELAKLFDINTTKIRFYERKGLLSPESISENGYRLYSIKNLEKLEVILLLREMDVDLEHIKKLLKGYTKDDYKDLLKNLRDETKKQINSLRIKLNLLDERLTHLRNYKHDDMHIIEYPERKYVIINDNLDSEITVKRLFDVHNKLNLKLSNYHDKYISEINPKTFEMNKGVMNKELLAKAESIKIMPAGKYLEIKRDLSFSKNSIDNTKSILKAIRDNGYNVEGFLYGVEDYRLFLFSNITQYYTFEIKIKE